METISTVLSSLCTKSLHATQFVKASACRPPSESMMKCNTPQYGTEQLHTAIYSAAQ